MSRPFLAPGATPPAEPPRFPPRPTPNSPPRRRGLLSAVAALAVAPAVVEAVPAGDPDASLRTICAQITREYAQIQTIGRLPLGVTEEEESVIEETFEKHCARRDALAEQAAAIAALTMAGIGAKTEAARLLAYKTGGLPDPDDQPDYVCGLVWSILADVSRLTGGAA